MIWILCVLCLLWEAFFVLCVLNGLCALFRKGRSGGRFYIFLNLKTIGSRKGFIILDFSSDLILGRIPYPPLLHYCALCSFSRRFGQMNEQPDVRTPFFWFTMTEPVLSGFFLSMTNT